MTGQKIPAVALAALKDGFRISRSPGLSFKTFRDPAQCYGLNN